MQTFFFSLNITVLPTANHVQSSQKLYKTEESLKVKGNEIRLLHEEYEYVDMWKK